MLGSTVAEPEEKPQDEGRSRPPSVPPTTSRSSSIGSQPSRASSRPPVPIFTGSPPPVRRDPVVAAPVTGPARLPTTPPANETREERQSRGARSLARAQEERERAASPQAGHRRRQTAAPAEPTRVRVRSRSPPSRAELPKVDVPSLLGSTAAGGVTGAHPSIVGQLHGWPVTAVERGRASDAPRMYNVRALSVDACIKVARMLEEEQAQRSTRVGDTMRTVLASGLPPMPIPPAVAPPLSWYSRAGRLQDGKFDDPKFVGMSMDERTATVKPVVDPALGTTHMVMSHVTACTVFPTAVGVILARDQGFGGFWSKLSEYVLNVLVHHVGVAQLGMTRGGWVDLAKVWELSGVQEVISQQPVTERAIIAMAKEAAMDPVPFMCLAISQYSHKIQMLLESVSNTQVAATGTTETIMRGCYQMSEGMQRRLGSTEVLVMTRLRSCEEICVNWIDISRIGGKLGESEKQQLNGVAYWIAPHLQGLGAARDRLIRPPYRGTVCNAGYQGGRNSIYVTLHAFHPSSGNHDVIGRSMAHYAVQVDLADLDRAPGRLWMMPSGRLAVVGPIPMTCWRSYSTMRAGEWVVRWADENRPAAPIDDLAALLARSAAVANTRVSKNELGSTEAGRLSRTEALEVDLLSQQTASLALNHPSTAVAAAAAAQGSGEPPATGLDDATPNPYSPCLLWLGPTEAETAARLQSVVNEAAAEPVLATSVPQDERLPDTESIPPAIQEELKALELSVGFGTDVVSRSIDRQRQIELSLADHQLQQALNCLPVCPACSATHTFGEWVCSTCGTELFYRFSDLRRIQRTEAYRTRFGYSEITRGQDDKADYRLSTGQKRSGAAAPAREIKRIRSKFKLEVQNDPVGRYVYGVLGRMPLIEPGDLFGQPFDPELIQYGNTEYWTSEMFRVHPWHWQEPSSLPELPWQMSAFSKVELQNTLLKYRVAVAAVPQLARTYNVPACHDMPALMERIRKSIATAEVDSKKAVKKLLSIIDELGWNPQVFDVGTRWEQHHEALDAATNPERRGSTVGRGGENPTPSRGVRQVGGASSSAQPAPSSQPSKGTGKRRREDEEQPRQTRARGRGWSSQSWDQGGWQDQEWESQRWGQSRGGRGRRHGW